MSEETKRRIIEAGADLVHRQGFNNTGLKDILRAADVPKGSFYFYFDNKEAFGLEMVDYYSERFGTMLKPILQDDTLPPLEKLRAIFDAFHAYFKAEGYVRGCPLGNLGAEMSDLSPRFRNKIKDGMDRMIAMFETLLSQAQANGDLSENMDIHQTSIFILEAWHGALTRMKVTKDGEALTICHAMLFDKILR